MVHKISLDLQEAVDSSENSTEERVTAARTSPWPLFLWEVNSKVTEVAKRRGEERSVSAGAVLTWNHNVGKDWDMDDRLYARLWWVGIAKMAPGCMGGHVRILSLRGTGKPDVIVFGGNQEHNEINTGGRIIGTIVIVIAVNLGH